MERVFTARKGGGRFRINVIAWPHSVMVLLRGNDTFLAGEGVATFDIVSNVGPLYAGNIRYRRSELLFAVSGADARARVAASSGWNVAMNGRRIARFPMLGAGAAMSAVERCANLPASDPKAIVAQTSPDTEQPTDPSTGQSSLADRATTTAVLSPTTGVTARPVGTPAGLPNLADARQLRAIAASFSHAISRPDFRVTAYDGGVLQWSYGDALSSGAAAITQQAEPARSYASRLAIRADECDDSVLTLPLRSQTIEGGTHAALVSMCREAASVTVRHVHVATRLGAETIVVNFETQVSEDGDKIPTSSDSLTPAFLDALQVAAGG